MSLQKRKTARTHCLTSRVDDRTRTGSEELPTDITIHFSPAQIQAAAKAWLEWQFKGRKWEEATDSMREKFIEGTIIVLSATIQK